VFYIVKYVLRLIHMRFLLPFNICRTIVIQRIDDEVMEVVGRSRAKSVGLIYPRDVFYDGALSRFVYALRLYVTAFQFNNILYENLSDTALVSARESCKRQ
jgi:hypothetical protein